MTIKCSKCGEILEPEDAICPACGNNIRTYTVVGMGGSVAGGPADVSTRKIDKENNTVIESHLKEDNEKMTLDEDIVPNEVGEDITSIHIEKKKTKPWI